MVNGKVSLQKSSISGSIARRLKSLSDKDVLVGIPQDHSSRKGEQINNAELMYIHTNGSPINNIPPRPVLEPSIKANKEIIGRQLANASKAALSKDPDGQEDSLNKAGLLASSAAKAWFTNPANGWPPNSEETIKRKGSDKPLIDTGQLRKAITYVVRDKND